MCVLSLTKQELGGTQDQEKLNIIFSTENQDEPEKRVKMHVEIKNLARTFKPDCFLVVLTNFVRL